MTGRRWLVLGVLVLSGAQTVYWLVGSFLAYIFRSFLLEPGSPLIAERTRNAYLLSAWFVVNAIVVGVYAARRSRVGTWLMTGLQTANVGYGLWLASQALSSTCEVDQSWGLLLQPAIAAGALVLLYMVWRRFEDGTKAIRSLLISVLLIGLGPGLLIYGWRLGVQGIHVHSGAVDSVTNNGYGTILTVGSIARPMYFDSTDFAGLPPVFQGQPVVLLTADSPTCGYGAPMAIEVAGVTYVDQTYGGDVAGYTPETWAVHEAIRVAALVAGFILASLGLVSLLRWVESGVTKETDADR